MSIIDLARSLRPSLAIAATTLGLGQLQKLAAEAMETAEQAQQLIAARAEELAHVESELAARRLALEALETEIAVREAGAAVARTTQTLRGIVAERTDDPGEVDSDR